MLFRSGSGCENFIKGRSPPIIVGRVSLTTVWADSARETFRSTYSGQFAGYLSGSASNDTNAVLGQGLATALTTSGPGRDAACADIASPGQEEEADQTNANHNPSPTANMAQPMMIARRINAAANTDLYSATTV